MASVEYYCEYVYGFFIMEWTMINKYINDIDLNFGATQDVICATENDLRKILPDDYKEFIKEHNGGEGYVGGLSYINLWKIEEIAELNESYEVKEYTPDFVYFGSDGGDMAYAMDFSEEKVRYIEFPFMSLHEEEKEILGDSFEEMLMTLYNRR